MLVHCLKACVGGNCPSCAKMFLGHRHRIGIDSTRSSLLELSPQLTTLFSRGERKKCLYSVWGTVSRDCRNTGLGGGKAHCSSFCMNICPRLWAGWVNVNTRLVADKACDKPLLFFPTETSALLSRHLAVSWSKFKCWCMVLLKQFRPSISSDCC